MKYTLSVVFCRLVHKNWNYIYPKWWTTRIQATQKVSFIIIFFSIIYHFNARTTVKEPKSNWSSFLLWIFTSYKIIFGGERTNKNKLPVKNSGRVSSGKKWKTKPLKERVIASSVIILCRPSVAFWNGLIVSSGATNYLQS